MKAMNDYGVEKTENRIERFQIEKQLGKAVLMAIICLISGIAIWYTSTLTIVLKDTLNTLNDQQQEINGLRTDVYNLELLYQLEEKNDTAVQNTPLSVSDRELIERICQAEAGSNLIGCMAVAQVISDRANLWSMTPYQVVNQDGQFAAPASGEISPEATQAVWAVFDEGMKAFEDNNVTHFYAEDSQEPYWIVNKDFVGEMGGNLFYESRY